MHGSSFLSDARPSQVRPSAKNARPSQIRPSPLLMRGPRRFGDDYPHLRMRGPRRFGDDYSIAELRRLVSMGSATTPSWVAFKAGCKAAHIHQAAALTGGSATTLSWVAFKAGCKVVFILGHHLQQQPTVRTCRRLRDPESHGKEVQET